MLCFPKLISSLPGANPPLPEHKIGIFVRFWGWEPHFRAFRAQNRGFCALLGLRTLVSRHFEHKIEVFVRFWGWEPSFSGISSTKSRFLCAFGVGNPCFRAFRAQNRGFCALLPASFFPMLPQQLAAGHSVQGLPRCGNSSSQTSASLHGLPLLRHSKSFGPSAPIAYATCVSPPDEAAAWPGQVSDGK